MRADLKAAFENWNRYRGRLQDVAQAVYGQYLKSQGIEEGIKSYDRFAALMVAAQKAAMKRSAKTASKEGCSLDLRLELVNLVGRDARKKP